MTIYSLGQRLALSATLSAALSVLSPATIAFAELGGAMAGTQASSQGDSQGSAPVTLLDGAMLMRTSIDAGGTTVNEYASNTGRIFAYTWQGPTMPDLTALLGPYNASYRAGATAGLSEGRDLHASHVAGADVVVESGGQMRSYVGRAWLPAALPAGVKPDDLN
ncbi:MAG: DUF2844 domain-containing protein [Paraburkholderia sp.]|uniref:DUF2844 domain-containing protein n=1 Tax=Paraburkholderia sp. TaxID=1926495 RepID=UPI003C3A3BD3